MGLSTIPRIDFRRAASHRAAVVRLLLAFLLVGAPAAWAQGERIEKIVWEGLRRIPRDTMNARILSKPGDPYNPDILRRDFQAVWNTEFFEDVRLEVEDGESGKIIYFIVEERPLIRRINYEGVKSVTEAEILGRFRERRVGLSVQMQYDPTRIRRAEVVLKELLAEQGRHFAQVGHDLQRIPPNAVILTFVVDEGPKVKVGDFEFMGNRRFSDRKLMWTMKGSRPYGIPHILGLFSKTYNANKVQEDLERIRELYQEHGYFRVVVHPPETRTEDTEPFLPLQTMPWWFKEGKKVDMRIEIEEGSVYRMGETEVRSATGEPSDLFFHPDFLKAAFPLKQGDIFNVTKIREGLEQYQKLFSQFGFINMTVIPETDIDDESRVIDMALEFEPNKQFFVHRIEFVGNTTTRDKVIRRELLLDEGSVFNGRLWEVSILRLNQLGYFEELRPESAEVQQNAAEGTVDLTLKVKERGKNSIGFNGGASGVFGSFIGLNYSTNNFLGLGETLNLGAQFGDRNQSFQFGFTEPYLFDRPIQTGFNFFVSRFEFDQARETALFTGRQSFSTDPALNQSLVNFNQNTVGFSVFTSYPLKVLRFARLGVTYRFSRSNVACLTEGCSTLFNNIQFRSFAGPSAAEGVVSSRVTPTFVYNTVNDPMFPTEGTRVFVGAGIEGGLLGGNQNSFSPTFEIKHFRPINNGRNTLAFRLLGAFITGYGGRVPSPFNRFYIGGEDTVRGFDIRAVSPIAFVPQRSFLPVVFLDPTQLDPNGNPTVQVGTVEVLSQRVTLPGGDTQLVGNFEYRIPIAGPVSIAPFFDAGITTILRPGQLRLTRENLAQIRADFPGTAVSDNLEIADGTNGLIRTSTGLELVINLPIVNAPFRIYWAYNLTRLDEFIQAPSPGFREPEGFNFPPGVFENQVLPNLQRLGSQGFNVAEELKVFRFTISRTF